MRFFALSWLLLSLLVAISYGQSTHLLILELNNNKNATIEQEVNIPRLQNSVPSLWWIELGDKIMFGVDADVAATAIAIVREEVRGVLAFTYSHVNIAADEDIYVIQRSKHSIRVTFLENRLNVLMSGWGFSVATATALHIQEKESILSLLPKEGYRIQKFDGKNTTLVRVVQNPNANSTGKPPLQKADPVSSLVGLVDGDRWFSDVGKLATFNRYTLGANIADAQAWLLTQLDLVKKTTPQLTITTQSFPVRSTIGYNIVATLTGHQNPDTWVIIGAHYDSTSQSPTVSAPGAEDNGSGAAALLEMVRVFATQPPPSTAIFIFFSGEEQGLYGSKYDASLIVSQGNKYKVKQMHNMDMIAYKAKTNTKFQVLLETNPPYTGLFPAYTDAALNFTNLELLYSTYAFGSDHEPYLNQGIPALLTIDGDWESYPDYHRTTDTIDKCDKELGTQIIRMGVGALAVNLGY